MPSILFKTRGNTSPGGKRRIYFTCHPEDFEKNFEKICDDIFKTQDVTVYYTEDLAEEFTPEELETDIASSNLFVVPVTLRLLSQPNRAMDQDIVFARQKHIPILPFMMESGLDAIYSRVDRFGELQYLQPESNDPTQIGYEEKLKNYLESVLVSDETVKRIQMAFDAYIFLSYRKKDRSYANTLMRFIHENPKYRDIAVWYDEFLTPGESFRENIIKMLDRSDVFTMLVTPSLLEGSNYVMTEEYPLARNTGKHIIPVEMEATDKEQLSAKFCDIPNCVDMQALSAVLDKLAKEENDDPQHNYLIGLAYLDGIDVEIDRSRGMEMITAAAEAGLPEAMQMLYHMYLEGQGVSVDYRQARVWIQKIVEHNTACFGEESEQTLSALHELGFTCGKIGDHESARNAQEKVYELRCKLLGTSHPHTLAAVNNLAITYGHLGDQQRALELQKTAYALYCVVLGPEHPQTLSALNNLAYSHGELGQYDSELELQQKAYDLRCKVLGPEHPDALASLQNLAYIYGKLGDHTKEFDLQEAVCSLLDKVMGPEHPETLSALNNLAVAYGARGDHLKALELLERIYALQGRLLGSENPSMLRTMNNLAQVYRHCGQMRKSMELQKEVYDLCCKVMGRSHPKTLTAWNNLAGAYEDMGEWKSAEEIYRSCCELQCEVLGQEHPDTLLSMSNLALNLFRQGEHQNALEIQELVVKGRLHALGVKHPSTMNSLSGLIQIHMALGNTAEARELYALYQMMTTQ